MYHMISYAHYVYMKWLDTAEDNLLGGTNMSTAINKVLYLLCMFCTVKWTHDLSKTLEYKASGFESWFIKKERNDQV